METALFYFFFLHPEAKHPCGWKQPLQQLPPVPGKREDLVQNVGDHPQEWTSCSVSARKQPGKGSFTRVNTQKKKSRSLNMSSWVMGQRIWLGFNNRTEFPVLWMWHKAWEILGYLVTCTYCWYSCEQMLKLVAFPFKFLAKEEDKTRIIWLCFSFFKVSDRCSQRFYYSVIRESTFLLNI